MKLTNILVNFRKFNALLKSLGIKPVKGTLTDRQKLKAIVLLVISNPEILQNFDGYTSTEKSILISFFKQKIKSVELTALLKKMYMDNMGLTEIENKKSEEQYQNLVNEYLVTKSRKRNKELYDEILATFGEEKAQAARRRLEDKMERNANQIDYGYAKTNAELFASTEETPKEKLMKIYSDYKNSLSGDDSLTLAVLKNFKQFKIDNNIDSKLYIEDVIKLYNTDDEFENVETSSFSDDELSLLNKIDDLRANNDGDAPSLLFLKQQLKFDTNLLLMINSLIERKILIKYRVQNTDFIDFDFQNLPENFYDILATGTGAPDEYAWFPYDRFAGLSEKDFMMKLRNYPGLHEYVLDFNADFIGSENYDMEVGTIVSHALVDLYQEEFSATEEELVGDLAPGVLLYELFSTKFVDVIVNYVKTEIETREIPDNVGAPDMSEEDNYFDFEIVSTNENEITVKENVSGETFVWGVTWAYNRNPEQEGNFFDFSLISASEDENNYDFPLLKVWPHELDKLKAGDFNLETIEIFTNAEDFGNLTYKDLVIQSAFFALSESGQNFADFIESSIDFEEEEQTEEIDGLDSVEVDIELTEEDEDGDIVVVVWTTSDEELVYYVDSDFDIVDVLIDGESVMDTNSNEFDEIVISTARNYVDKDFDGSFNPANETEQTSAEELVDQILNQISISSETKGFISFIGKNNVFDLQEKQELINEVQRLLDEESDDMSLVGDMYWKNPTDQYINGTPVYSDLDEMNILSIDVVLPATLYEIDSEGNIITIKENDLADRIPLEDVSVYNYKEKYSEDELEYFILEGFDTHFMNYVDVYGEVDENKFVKKYFDKIVEFVNQNSMVDFDLESDIDDNSIDFSTRENGDVGAEQYSPVDYAEAKRLGSLIEAKFPAHVEYTTADEWVSFYVKTKE